MNKIFRPFFFVYQWFIAFPILAVATILTCLSTILLAYTAKTMKVKSIPAQWWSRLICYMAFMRISVEGRENIDPNESYIFAANHQSAFDIWLIYGWLNHPFSWIMKKELRKIPLVGAACASIGHIFIDRSSAVEAKKSIDNAKKILQNGNSIVIFPEGTRSSTGKVGVFKRGGFALASDLNLRIVPITIIGAYDRMSRHTSQVTPGRLKMVIHPPISFKPDATELETRESISQVRDVIVKGLEENQN